MNRLFLLYDDLEEFLIVAKSPADVLEVIAKKYGEDSAEEFLLSKTEQYPDGFMVSKTKTVERFCEEKERGIIDRGDPGSFLKPSETKQC